MTASFASSQGALSLRQSPDSQVRDFGSGKGLHSLQCAVCGRMIPAFTGPRLAPPAPSVHHLRACQRAGTTLTGETHDTAPHWAAVVIDGELSAGSQVNSPSPSLEGDLLVEVRVALTQSRTGPPP